MRTAWYLSVLGLVLPMIAQAVDLKGSNAGQRERGLLVFQTYCMTCHGSYADGKGKSAKNLKPPPANLRTSVKTDQYKEEIIRKGGAAVGRSPFMPPWGQELSDQQIADVVYYLRSITGAKSKPK